MSNLRKLGNWDRAGDDEIRSLQTLPIREHNTCGDLKEP